MLRVAQVDQRGALSTGRSPGTAGRHGTSTNRPVVCSVGVMRIDVIDADESAPAQARAYAEYRLFATLARHARGIRSVRAVLHVERKGVTDRATCVVTVALEPSGSAVARAYGGHVHGAIDRAAGRIGDLINRRPPQITQS
jgi:hypothetical protein